MASKNLWRNSKFDFGDTSTDILVRLDRFVRFEYKLDLEKIVEPFETDIPFEIVEEYSNNKIIIGVQAKPGVFSSNRARGEIETAKLFEYLNDGTDTRYAVMPSDFANETTPGSLSTTYQRYNRRRIYLDHISRGGIKGRQWLQILFDMKEKRLKQNVEWALEDGVDSALGLL